MRLLSRMRQPRGFSYIEAIVVIALIAVLSIMLMDVFISHGELFNKTMVGVDLQMQRARTLERLGTVTRVASSVQFSQMIGGTLYTSSGSTLVLAVPSIDSQGAVIAGTFDYAAFYLEPSRQNELHLIIGANALSSRASVNQMLADTVERLAFSYDRSLPEESEAVFVQAVLASSISGTDESTDVSGVFNLGNR